jgi:DNA-binding MarR family transcriptional regulator
MSSRRVPTDPASLRAWRDATLFRLLHRAGRAERAETAARVRARGHPTISLSYAELLSNLDTRGTSISDLARRAGVSRQAASQLLRSIERDGYVEREPHAGDARAVRVRMTPRGRALLSDALDVVRGIEAEYEDLLGREDLQHLRRILTTLVQRTDAAGSFDEDGDRSDN